LSVGFSFFAIELKKVFTYRVEFWVGFLGTVLSQFGVAYFLWKAIFEARGVSSIEGYSFGALMLYYLMVPLVERCVHGQEMGFLSGEIYDGGLSRYLIYPIGYFRIKYLGQLAHSSLFLLQIFLAFAVFLLFFHKPFSMSFGSLAMTIPVLVFAGLLHFTLSVNLEMLAFWADNVWSISVLNRMITNLLGGGLLPLAFFPEKVRVALEYLPFSRLVSFPTRCLLGQVGAKEWLFGMALTLVWTGVFALFGAWIWRRGLRVYTGVGI
jgi:ABC-2 type transport system permease protein